MPILRLLRFEDVDDGVVVGDRWKVGWVCLSWLF